MTDEHDIIFQGRHLNPQCVSILTAETGVGILTDTRIDMLAEKIADDLKNGMWNKPPIFLATQRAFSGVTLPSNYIQFFPLINHVMWLYYYN